VALYKIDVFTFDPLIKRVIVDAGETLVTVQQTYNACREYEAELAALDNPSICKAGGKDELGSTKFVGITMTMLDGWQLEFTTVPSEITDGNFLGLDEAGASQNPIYGNVVTRSADTTAAIVTPEVSISPGDLTAIAAAVWNALTATYTAAGSFGHWVQKKLLTVSGFLGLSK
jgi:hypothetical protein